MDLANLTTVPPPDVSIPPPNPGITPAELYRLSDHEARAYPPELLAVLNGSRSGGSVGLDIYSL
ncbi:hypothetical protein FRC07_008938 [Ceratobasidium sp. 392]|nr:hypothetical protein FRC07_008938 [Ceratobasidium sp. 392]